MNESRMVDLYDFFDGCFPSTFERQFTGHPSGRKVENWYAVWSLALKKYNDEQIEKAKQKMIKRGFTYPPSLPEFVEIIESGITKLTI